MMILNEKVHVEEHYLKNNEIDMKPRDVISLLAKYYFQIKGYKPKKVDELLNDYLNRNYHYRYIASKSHWEDTIGNVIKKNRNSVIHEIDCIWITKSEIEKIQAINDRDLELVAFAHLCIAKLNNAKSGSNSGWFNVPMKELFSMVRVKRKDRERYLMQNDLYNLGLIEFPKRTGDLSTRVTFIDDDSEKVLRISDFRELGYEYLNFIGDGKYIRCAECGILFPHVNKGRPRKYCQNCTTTTKTSTNFVKCVDCGKYFEKNSNGEAKVRCDECQTVKIRSDTRERVRGLRRNLGLL